MEKISGKGYLTGKQCAFMVVALILIKTESGKERFVLEHIRKVPEVKDSHLLLGVYDISVKISVSETAELSKVVANKIRTIPGIVETKTLPAMSFSAI